MLITLHSSLERVRCTTNESCAFMVQNMPNLYTLCMYATTTELLSSFQHLHTCWATRAKCIRISDYKSILFDSISITRNNVKFWHMFYYTRYFDPIIICTHHTLSLQSMELQNFLRPFPFRLSSLSLVCVITLLLMCHFAKWIWKSESLWILQSYFDCSVLDVDYSDNGARCLPQMHLYVSQIYNIRNLQRGNGRTRDWLEQMYIHIDRI